MEYYYAFSRLKAAPTNSGWNNVLDLNVIDKAEAGLDSNIGHGLFVGWVEHPDIFCWVSFLYPTYVPTIFLLSAKPNKMAENKTAPQSHFSIFSIL